MYKSNNVLFCVCEQIFNLERKLELHGESEDSFEAGSIMNRKRG